MCAGRMQRTCLHSCGFKSNNTDITNALFAELPLPFAFCENVTNFSALTHGMINKTNDQ